MRHFTDPLPMPSGDGADLARYQGVNTLVLGATGFIGRWVAHALADQGAVLHIAGRDESRLEALAATLSAPATAHVADVQDDRRITNLVETVSPAIVFNLAGYGVDRAERDPALAVRINATLPGLLCDTLARTRDRSWDGLALVHTGSALEYGPVRGSLSEDIATRPETLYGMTKLEGTNSLRTKCRLYGVRGATARLFMVYGGGEHETRLFPSLLSAARSGQPLNMTSGTQLLDFTYVEDVAEGLLRLGLSNAPTGHIVNLATGVLTSVRTFAETAAGILELPADQLRFGEEPQRSDELAHGAIAIERLVRLTSWRPKTTIAEGIRATIHSNRKAHAAN
jgi:nucleoside-diphosphate-sugar epimerase